MRTPAVDFVGRTRIWAALSGVLLLVSLGAIVIGGLQLSIDFVGGSAFRLEGIDPATTAQDLQRAAQDAGAQDAISQLQGEGGNRGALVRTQALEPGGPAADRVEAALVRAGNAESSTTSFVGPTWGRRVTQQAVQALVVFVGVVVLYISFRLEFKMAVAAVLALIHDLVITVGLYALVGFTVSPATVIAVLTILGYSLYDTVVIFDRVKEDRPKLGGPGRRTYAQLVNTATNEVLFRSLNTAITSVMPVASLLFVGSQLLGETTLEDLALALFIGMLVGVYSSLFVAAPFYAWWKMREPAQQRAAARERTRAQRGDHDGALAAADRGQEHRPPITTEYVRGEGKHKRRRR